MEWELIKELLPLLGKKNVFGLAVGSGLDMNTSKTSCLSSDGRKRHFWHRTYFETIKEIHGELHREGFGHVRLTVALSSGARDPNTKVFVNDTNWPIADFLTRAYNHFGEDRWAWSFNVYPYWSALKPLMPCRDPWYRNASGRGVNELKDSVQNLRMAVKDITGLLNSTLWITETGWASQQVPDKPACEGRWPDDYATIAQLKGYYEGFLRWSADDLQPPPDKIFYYSNRDTADGQAFGLVDNCGQKQCKIQNSAEVLAM